MPRVTIEEFFPGETIRHGIEIGALHNPYQNKSGKIRIKYVDRMTVSDLRAQYPELKSRNLVNPDIIDDGESLKTVEDNTLDFIIANHFLEHCENLLRTVEAHIKKVKPGGILYYYVPNKDFTFDKKRDLTTTQHILDEYHNGHEHNRRSHYENWCKLVDNNRSNPDHLMQRNYSIHFHVWNLASFSEIVALIEKMLDVETVLHTANGNEICLILKKI